MINYWVFNRWAVHEEDAREKAAVMCRHPYHQLSCAATSAFVQGRTHNFAFPMTNLGSWSGLLGYQHLCNLCPVYVVVRVEASFCCHCTGQLVRFSSLCVVEHINLAVFRPSLTKKHFQVRGHLEATPIVLTGFGCIGQVTSRHSKPQCHLQR